MSKLNFFVKSQIESNVRSINSLINSGVFQNHELMIFQEPSFISIILKLNDLLQKLKLLNLRIDFNDDIPKGDITDLANRVRNAICHLDSKENMLGGESQIKFVFNIIIGKVNLLQIGDKTTVKSEYDDDIAFCYGNHLIYLKRHIVRAINESVIILREKYPEEIFVR